MLSFKCLFEMSMSTRMRQTSHSLSSFFDGIVSQLRKTNYSYEVVDQS